MKNLDKEFLTISEVENLTNVNTSTLRLWERYDLITPIRGKNNYRIYSSSDVQRIRDIVRMRHQEQMSLNAIQSALAKFNAEDEILDSISKKKDAVANKRTVGWKLKALRREKGISLREVATQTGMTPSHISVLESTSKGASYETLSKLAKFYGTTLHDLNRVEPISPDIQITRGQGRLLPLYKQGLHIEQMADGFLKMDVTKVRLDPDFSSGDEPYSHNGEEYIYVLAGKFEITFDGAFSNLLQKNESIYFSSDRLHSWRNPGTKVAELLWINTVPSF